ncbi:cytochrome c [Rhizobium sp. P28RR-XV]|uniref:cytochrome c n=1 Tax=Rhizobium sp. P28RR-XV TaxID=2726737 RepID=UPI0014578E0E|nr:cytochrome c [Rhizobium sp. P28RR-XV]NLR88430.1 c-type cytochrome [Rhizobium sp. P28RR-XV]
MKIALPLVLFAAGLVALGLPGFAYAQSDDIDALVKKGQAIATAADCMACHTVPKTGKPYTGGYGIVSPLGTIYSSNITPSWQYGIGDYSEADFERAVRKGIRKDGSHLYPAMPYDAYGAITDTDLHALYAYFMRGVQPVDEAPKDYTALPFPFNMRISMAGWNLLFANRKPFTPDPARSEEINRGAYLVGALGHCASCHASRNILMGQGAGAPLAGGEVGPWYAPNITSDPISGIGGWTENELEQYFRTGKVEGKGQAAGGMAEAIDNSLQHLPDSDLKALAAYLKSTTPVRDPAEAKPRYAFGKPTSGEAEIRGFFQQTAHDSLKTGAELYSGFCASCHQPDGAGSANQAYPSLFHNTATGAASPANLIATILYGVQRDVGDHAILMPGFSKGSFVAELTDEQIADIANYVLTTYGNPDTKVTPQDVASARRGGPMPFLARVQPYVLPALAVAGGTVVLVFAVIIATRQTRRKSLA